MDFLHSVQRDNSDTQWRLVQMENAMLVLGWQLIRENAVVEKSTIVETLQCWVTALLRCCRGQSSLPLTDFRPHEVQIQNMNWTQCLVLDAGKCACRRTISAEVVTLTWFVPRKAVLGAQHDAMEKTLIIAVTAYPEWYLTPHAHSQLAC